MLCQQSRDVINSLSSMLYAALKPRRKCSSPPTHPRRKTAQQARAEIFPTSAVRVRTFCCQPSSSCATLSRSARCSSRLRAAPSSPCNRRSAASMASSAYFRSRVVRRSELKGTYS